jgi:hypothetical protein
MVFTEILSKNSYFFNLSAVFFIFVVVKLNVILLV